MIYGYRYKAMTITGIFHLVIGIITIIVSLLAIIEGAKTRHPGIARVYLPCNIVVTISSLWVILTGVFGIFAGKTSYPEQKTLQMKTAYMVIAILSACIFALASCSAFSALSILVHVSYSPVHKHLYGIGSFLMFVEFVLAIVSSSICCCCPNDAVQGVVIMQTNQEAGFTNPTTPYYPPNTQQGPNTTATYPAGSHPYPYLNMQPNVEPVEMKASEP